MKNIELLAPAGDLEKLKIAVIYGADAVYIGGQTFGLRAAAKNFSFEDMKEGIQFAHERGKKVYVTLNIIPHNADLEELSSYLKQLKTLNIDALILSDPGTLMYVREHMPNVDTHLSTQANTTNYMSALFWYKQGVKRIILARELSITEIKEIRKQIPPDLELEAFIHGAMCISYSGRCLLSNYMANRDANRGECAHPCRWKYYLMEEKRPGEYIPVFEDEKGTYFFHSKDLCMIEHIPELIESGLNSFKIEGRMKSIYYVATIVNAYRRAIDTYLKNKESYQYNHQWMAEIKKASHREFTTGFYFEKPGPQEQSYSNAKYIREYSFLGVVLDYDSNSKIATIEQRNKISKGDIVEIMGPDIEYFVQKIDAIWDEEGDEIQSAPHPQQIIKIKVNQPVKPYYLLRKES